LTIGYPNSVNLNANAKFHHFSGISIDIGKKMRKKLKNGLKVGG